MARVYDTRESVLSRAEWLKENYYDEKRSQLDFWLVVPVPVQKAFDKLIADAG